jgi:hypothetical protein
MLEEKMKLKTDKIERLMTRLNWTPRVFADVIKVEMPEAYKLLSGAAVGYYTARAFITYFKAVFAAAFIDFAAMEMDVPKFLKLKPQSESDLFSNIAANVRKTAKENKQP